MKKTVFVTMDMDWACDGVLADTVALAEELELPVCLFVTNDTPMLQTLRNHPLFTLGIHPNFVPLLNGQSDKDFLKVLKDMHDLVPEARVIRCHALVDATPILCAAKEMGFLADMNLFLPHSSGTVLRSFRHFSGLTRLPFFYEDDAWALEDGAAGPEEHAESEGLKIFNFHPIHLYLNTENMERYTRAKPYYHEYENLAGFVNHDGAMGARDFLIKLAKYVRENGMRFGEISELWQ